MITLKDWYQLDFSLPNPSFAKNVLLSIDKIMTQLVSKNLIKSWFFLYEGDTIRIRMKGKNAGELEKELTNLASKNNLELSDKLSFSEYQESDETLFNKEFVEAFTKIMSEATNITIQKLKGELQYDNYRALERLQHCLFNIMLTLGFKTEEHFLVQRLHERVGRNSDKDFENKL